MLALFLKENKVSDVQMQLLEETNSILIPKLAGNVSACLFFLFNDFLFFLLFFGWFIDKWQSGGVSGIKGLHTAMPWFDKNTHFLLEILAQTH